MTETESGTLDQQPVGSLLRSLAARSFTGIVHIDGSVERILCLAEGRLYLATSSSGPSLQRVLVEFGAVDDAGWTRAIEAAPEQGSVVTALLADGGDRSVIEHALHELNVGTLLELLVPDREQFRAVDDETHQFGAAVSFDVDAILSDAGERLERWGSLSGRLPSMNTVLRRVAKLPPGQSSIELGRVQWRIIDALGTPTTLAALIEQIGLGAFGIFEELYRLLADGVVVIDEDTIAPA